jgi:hypothetical protein
MTSWQKHFLKLFLGLSLGFTLSMLVVQWLLSSTLLWSNLPLGFGYGLLMTWVAMRRLRRRLKAAGIEAPYSQLDFSPKQRATIESPFAPEEIPDRLRQDLNFRFAKIEQNGHTLSLKTQGNEYSRGERVTLQAEPLPAGHYRYQIHSRPLSSWQFTDTANGLLLVRALQRQLQATREPSVG